MSMPSCCSRLRNKASHSSVPLIKHVTWQARTEGAFDLTQFQIDWQQHKVVCPQGHSSISRAEYVERTGNSYCKVRFAARDCGVCPVRRNCTQAQSHKGRVLKLMRQAEYEAIQAARLEHASPEGQERYKRRAGVEGTISQGVRAFGLRRTRYRGLSKTHLQHVATAAAINLVRLGDWLRVVPRAVTRTSRFATLTARADF